MKAIPLGPFLLLMLGLSGATLGGGPERAAWEWLGLGFWHIIPGGVDHVLFVVALLLAAADLRVVLLQVTAFTLAHSLTFGLALHGLVALPERAVEAAVAFSIGFVALENLWAARLPRWRLGVVFGFGLVHGLAFAHTFRGHVVAPGEWSSALLAFNVGVELGQMTVVAVALAMMAPWWQRPWYRKACAVPASGLMALTGLVWAAVRLAV